MKTTKFKPSEVGPVPVEWDVKRLGDCGFCFNGISGKSGSDFGHGKSRYITFLNVLSNVVIDSTIFDVVDIKPGENQNEVRRGDLFFNTSSETPEEVGFCAVLNQDVRSVYLNSFCFGFRLTDKAVSGEFLAYWFRSAGGRSLMTFLAQGSTRYNLSKEAFRDARVAIPSTYAEQQAIAAVLSDVDALLSSMTTLIEKKRAIKQGAMQQLLTGKNRLAGFTGKWVEKRLGECGRFSKGAGISRSQADSGRIPAVRYGELYTTHCNYIKSFTSFISEDVAQRATRLNKGDIVFACSGETKEEIGKCAAFIGDEVAYAGGDLIIFSPNKSCDALFIGFELNTPFCASQKAAAGQGDAVVHIRKESLEALIVRLPPSFAEQQAIAVVLADLDAEIALLEAKRAKYESVKQGMMQELLTGKTRLV